MDTLCPDESVSSAKRKRVITRKLVEGHEAATQLKLLLQKPSAGADNEGSLSVDELVANVQRSFTESLSVLTSNSAGENGSPAAASGNDDSREGRKRSSPPSKSGGRGCYKRRRNAQSWTKVSPTVDDHHAWRKYGQKDILNSKFPRSYFRCTQKYDQGCRATKQVQMTQENPEIKYKITYIGIHTCKATTSKPPHLVMDSTASFFENSHPGPKVLNEQNHHPISSQTPTIKEENSEEDIPGDATDNHKLDPTIWSELKDFGVDSVHFGSHDFHFDGTHELL